MCFFDFQSFHILSTIHCSHCFVAKSYVWVQYILNLIYLFCVIVEFNRRDSKSSIFYQDYFNMSQAQEMAKKSKRSKICATKQLKAAVTYFRYFFIEINMPESFLHSIFVCGAISIHFLFTLKFALSTPTFINGILLLFL